ncbi:hypothetical protein Dimus_033712, partial [Dionaea muscipula]
MEEEFSDALEDPEGEEDQEENHGEEGREEEAVEYVKEIPNERGSAEAYKIAP